MKNVNQKSTEKHLPFSTPCLCAALRQASRAVTRIYDDELRATGLLTTQHAVLRLLGRVGEVRKGDLGEMASLDETTLTRGLRLLEKAGWVTIRPGADRREKRIAITEAGVAKVEQAREAWDKAQDRMRRALPEGTWESLLTVLSVVTRSASETKSSESP
jgi:DNA-binding MarR family transcriptional regulator